MRRAEGDGRRGCRRAPRPRDCPGSAYMRSRFTFSKVASAISTARLASRASWTRPMAFRLRVVEALDADREAVHARVAEVAELRLLEGAGVRLQRDLGVGLHRQQRARRGEEAVDRARREEAGRAAADEDRVHAPAPYLRHARLEVRDHRVHVARLGHLAPRLVRVEVAVGALLQAPRDVDVERERRQGRERARSDRAGREGDRLHGGSRRDSPDQPALWGRRAKARGEQGHRDRAMAQRGSSRRARAPRPCARARAGGSTGRSRSRPRRAACRRSRRASAPRR